MDSFVFALVLGILSIGVVTILNTQDDDELEEDADNPQTS